MISFVHYFIALNVDGPICCRIDCGKRFIGFYCEHTTIFAEGIVPGGLNDLNLRFDVLNEPDGVVVRIANCNHYFVTKW